MCRVNLSLLRVKYCCVGFCPLAKTRITGIPCCRADGTSMRFRARLNLDLWARLLAAPTTDGFPTLLPRTKEAREEGGKDSWVPAEKERPTRLGFMLCNYFFNNQFTRFDSIRSNDAKLSNTKAFGTALILVVWFQGFVWFWATKIFDGKRNYRKIYRRIDDLPQRFPPSRRFVLSTIQWCLLSSFPWLDFSSSNSFLCETPREKKNDMCTKRCSTSKIKNTIFYVYFSLLGLPPIQKARKSHN